MNYFSYIGNKLSGNDLPLAITNLDIAFLKVMSLYMARRQRELKLTLQRLTFLLPDANLTQLRASACKQRKPAKRKKQMAMLIRANGTKESVYPANCKFFTPKELYSLLACENIEIIESGLYDFILAIDGFGKLKQAARNQDATEYMNSMYGNDYVAGNALLCNTQDIP